MFRNEQLNLYTFLLIKIILKKLIVNVLKILANRILDLLFFQSNIFFSFTYHKSILLNDVLKLMWYLVKSLIFKKLMPIFVEA